MKNSELIMHLFFSSLVQTWIRTGTLYLMLLYTCTVYCMGSLGNATCVRIGNYHLVLRVSNNTNCIQRPQFCQSAFASRLLCAISDEVAQHLVYFPCRPENYRKSTRRADSLIRKTSTTPSCSGPIPAQKSRGNSVPGVVFSLTMPKNVFSLLPSF